ncbi:unnamed protein product [Cuscuta epithymum]|uniref:Uncharacterized protein n=1 Tax=Cuscuta epithymum TaxID=186058 RepID=A0AAV0F5H0_9ASTE|nr:unnamed protein product [Cuscuta epithymum]
MDDFLAYLMVDGEVTGNDGGLEDTYDGRRKWKKRRSCERRRWSCDGGWKWWAVNEEDGGPNNVRDEDLGGTGGGHVTQGVNEVPIFDSRDDYSCDGEENSREKTN